MDLNKGRKVTEDNCTTGQTPDTGDRAIWDFTSNSVSSFPLRTFFLLLETSRLPSVPLLFVPQEKGLTQ